jgi:hypothetical protein
MQGLALGLHDDFLKYESERQNRIYKESRKRVDQATGETRAGDTHRKESRFDAPISQGFSNGLEEFGNESSLQSAPEHRLGKDAAWTRQNAGRGNLPQPSGRPLDDPSGLMEESAYKVRRIPDIRSGLIPLGEEMDGNEWSKVFSLPKADMEPWISFLQGYSKSRLFLEPTPSERNRIAPGQSEPLVDFAVRAILDLKQISDKVIREPLVQIKGTTDYLDLSGELRVCHDPAHAKSLIKNINDIHASQLKKATEKGREMGDLLYEALMGDGYVNLVNAWEKVYRRKPNVEELHLMLTTGRLNRSPQERPQGAQLKATRLKENLHPNKIDAGDPQTRQGKFHQAAAVSAAVQSELPGTGIGKVQAAEKNAGDQKQNRDRKWKKFLYAFYVSLCCAGFIAYVLIF